MSSVARARLLVLAAACALFAPWVNAHVMQVPYTLPVPFWLYAYGATGALLASFAVVGFFVRGDASAGGQRTLEVTRNGFARLLASPAVLGFFRFLSVAALALTIATGLFGTRYPAANFNITFFWVVFALGLTYAVAIVGDVYRVVNPWRVLCDWCERAWPGLFRARVAYPTKLAWYPALVLYMAFIWIELFGRTLPGPLSLVLLGYTVANLVAAWIFGKDAWFRYGEFFSVFFWLVGKQASVEYRCADGRRTHAEVHLRAPFLGLIAERAGHFSLLLFVLFMLSSTAFDGIHETVPWVAIFWRGVYPILATVVAKDNPQQYLVLVNFFYYWQWLMLFVSPFLYLALYLFFIALTKRITKSALSVRELALHFAFSLVPIAFVYNVTHYFTLLVSQGPAIVPLLSDPFGFNWNLLGTKTWYAQQYMLEAGTVWHIQVGLILFGHIVSVYLAHVEALKVFGSARKAALSQIPLLLLMVMLTTIGLWILSLPIAAGQVLLPPAAGG